MEQFPAPIGQIIQDNNLDFVHRLLTYILQFIEYVGADKPGSARHKYVHGYAPILKNY